MDLPALLDGDRGDPIAERLDANDEELRAVIGAAIRGAGLCTVRPLRSGLWSRR